MTTTLRWMAVAALALTLLSCGKRRRIDTDACKASVEAGDAVTCAPAGYETRRYDLVVPEGYTGEPVPLLLVLHGGGGDRTGALRTTCPGGELDDPQCIHTLASSRGYAVAFPDGTPDDVLSGLRTWNAGGGVDTWRCTSGQACEDGVDDVAYIRALVEDIRARLAVDPARVYTTGLSNGGAMSFRLACEAADLIAAAAPIGGAMQLTVAEPCEPTRPVPILFTHGTADTCWNYDGGAPSCAGGITGQPGLEHVSVARTLSEWSTINGCGAGDPAETTLPDSAEDGTITTELRYEGCDADLVHLRVEGGGHVWPNGHQYLGVAAIGPVWRDWGNARLFDFFDAHAAE